MNFTRSIVLGATGAAVIGTAVFAASHAGKPPAVVARQSHMELFEFNIGTLVQFARGAVEFDAEASQRAADNLLALAKIDTTDYWPEGTSTDDIEGTLALPVIWQEVPAVMAEVEKLQTSIAALAENAGSLEGVRANLGPVGGACTSCHEKYRQPD